MLEHRVALPANSRRTEARGQRASRRIAFFGETVAFREAFVTEESRQTDARTDMENRLAQAFTRSGFTLGTSSFLVTPCSTIVSAFLCLSAAKGARLLRIGSLRGCTATQVRRGTCAGLSSPSVKIPPLLRRLLARCHRPVR